MTCSGRGSLITGLLTRPPAASPCSSSIARFSSTRSSRAGRGLPWGGSGSLFTQASMAARDRRDFSNTVAVIPSGVMDLWKIYGGFFTFGKSVFTTPYAFYDAISRAVATEIPAYIAVVMVFLALFDFGVNIWVLRYSMRDYKEIKVLQKTAEKRAEERKEEKEAEIQMLVGGGKADNFNSFQIMFGNRIHIIRNLTTLPNIVIRIYILAIVPLNPSPVSTPLGILSLLLFAGSVIWVLGQHTLLVATYDQFRRWIWKKGGKNKHSLSFDYTKTKRLPPHNPSK